MNGEYPKGASDISPSDEEEDASTLVIDCTVSDCPHSRRYSKVMFDKS